MLVVSGCSGTPSETPAPIDSSSTGQLPTEDSKAGTTTSSTCESLFLQWFGITDHIVDVDIRLCEGEAAPFAYTDTRITTIRHAFGTARARDGSMLQLAVYSPAVRHGHQGFTACIASEDPDAPAFIAAHRKLCSRVPKEGYPNPQIEFATRCAAGEFDREFGDGLILAIHDAGGYATPPDTEVVDVTDCLEIPLLS